MSLEIRLADGDMTDDVNGIDRVKARVWSELSDPKHIANAIREPDHVTHIALVDRVVVGFVSGFMTLSIEGVRRWEVDLLAVQPEFQRQGIARRLVAHSTIAGQNMGASMARGLVGIDNIASQHTFARNNYRPDETKYGLYLSTNDTRTHAEPPLSSHLIPVVTMNYRGVWIEGQLSPQALAAAQSVRTRYNWQVAGALIPESATAISEHALEIDFMYVGTYQWWGRHL